MIFITGATGHLGNVLVRELARKGYKTRALVLPGEDYSYINGPGIEFVKGDILNTDLMQEYMQGCDLVFHLAGIVSIAPGAENIMHQINVEGTHSMLKAARAAKVKRFVYTSSIHAFGRVNPDLIISEELPFDENYSAAGYEKTKALASQAVLKAAEEGFNAVVVCPSGVLGPFDYKRSEMGEMILAWMKKGPDYIVNGAYDFVDVRDVASGHILAAEKGRAGQVYILSGHKVSLQDLVAMVAVAIQRHDLVISFPIQLVKSIASIAELFYRMTRTRPRLTRYALQTLESNCNISNAKAVQELGFTTRAMQETITDTVKWWQQNPEIHSSLRLSVLKKDNPKIKPLVRPVRG